MNTKEIAEACGLPLETCRRYLKTFVEFCPSRKVGRQRIYDDDVVMTVMMIRDGYTAGKPGDIIKDELSRHMNPVVDVAVSPPDENQGLSLPPEILEGISQMSGAIEDLQAHVRDQDEKIAAQRELLEQLQHDLDEIRSRSWREMLRGLFR